MTGLQQDTMVGGLHTNEVTQGNPIHQRLQPLRYLHDCSDCFRLLQNRRVGLAPTEKRRLCTAHANTSRSWNVKIDPETPYLGFGIATRNNSGG
jgi:hypothetical protein